MRNEELRERVAQAIYSAATGRDPLEENWEICSPVNVDGGEDSHQWYLDMADDAIATIEENKHVEPCTTA